jgi:hypothetical protein
MVLVPAHHIGQQHTLRHQINIKAQHKGSIDIFAGIIDKQGFMGIDLGIGQYPLVNLFLGFSASQAEGVVNPVEQYFKVLNSMLFGNKFA